MTGELPRSAAVAMESRQEVVATAAATAVRTTAPAVSPGPIPTVID
jgi:hypothetical protein